MYTQMQILSVEENKSRYRGALSHGRWYLGGVKHLLLDTEARLWYVDGGLTFIFRESTLVAAGNRLKLQKATSLRR